YSEDLDLFGKGSLFELLSQARTRGGEATLASWLLGPADAGTIRARQEAVAELREHLDLRESIYVAGEDARDSIHTDTLIAWAEAPAVLASTGLWVCAAVLTAAVIASAIYLRQKGNEGPFIVALSGVAAFGFWLRTRVLSVIAAVDHAVHDLELL